MNKKLINSFKILTQNASYFYRIIPAFSRSAEHSYSKLCSAEHLSQI